MAVGLRGDDDDRQCAPGAQRTHDLQPLDPRQAEVDQGDVDGIGQGRGEAGLAVGGLQDLEPLVGQDRAKHQPDAVVVLDHERASRHAAD